MLGVTTVMAISLAISQLHMQILISEMGNKVWRERENATQKLAAMDEAALPYIEYALAKTEVPEIAARCERLIGQFYNNIKPSEYKKVPWIDTLPKDYPDRQKIFDKYMKDKDRNGRSGDEQWEYPGYRNATREWIVDLHKGGMKKKDIVKILDSMVPGELEQLKRMHQHSYNNFSYPLPFPMR